MWLSFFCVWLAGAILTYQFTAFRGLRRQESKIIIIAAWPVLWVMVAVGTVVVLRVIHRARRLAEKNNG